MKHKWLVGFGALLLLAFTLSTLLPASPTAAHERTTRMRQEVGTNLLTNPGFEGIGLSQTNGKPNYGNWTRATFNGAEYGEIFTPEGWVTWWQEGDFKRPECKVIPNEPPFNSDPERVYQGYYSGMCFTFFGKQNAGYYQQVSNIPPNSVVEASFYAHAWSCNEDSPPRSCGDPHAFYFQVGIDPNGGTDPFASSIAWSGRYYHYDDYGLVGPVQATVGESGVATMFMRAYGKWPNKHNDAYMDSPTLKLVSQGETATPTSPPPPPTSDVPPTPRYTATPLPSGAIVHTVVSGDTLFGLALEYDVPLEQIYELNDLGPNDLLTIGQEIVIAVGDEPLASPTATPTPAPVEGTTEPTPTTAPTQEGNGGEGGGAPAAPPADEAKLCVLAYYDANNDMFRQPDAGEMPLPNAQITLVGTSGPLPTYTTDGISEPHCFEGLEPGTYVLRHAPPPGYKLTDTGQWNLMLDGGETREMTLGYVRDENAAPTAESGDAPNPTPGSGGAETMEPTPATSEPPEDGQGLTKVLNTVLRVSGIIVLLLAIVVAVLFFLSRRAM
jgi:LysM repeat protein